MERVLIFGATPEARNAAQALRHRGRQVMFSVITEYEREKLPVGSVCHVGRLNAEAMLAFVREVNPRSIIDATHPYAVIANRNIQQCADALGIHYERVTFQQIDTAWRDAVEWCETPGAIITAIQRTEGNVLLGIGHAPIDLVGRQLDRSRLYPRIAPTVEAITACHAAGFLQQNIIAMDGPFSKALTTAFLDEKNFTVVAVKDATDSDYLHEMVIPALERGMHVIMFGRKDA